MKKLNKYQLSKISKNLDTIFNASSIEDQMLGMEWYKNANKFCVDISKKYNTTPLIVASVISALSPRNKWDQNLKDAINVLEAIKEGKKPEEIKVCTFHRNKFKSFAIAKGKIVISEESRKTYNFVRNIAHLDTTNVTIDIWHIRACLLEFKNINTATIGKLAYSQIKKLTIKKAKEINISGFQYQAIIWLSCQNNTHLLN